MLYHYTVSKNAKVSDYEKACLQIENNITNIKKDTPTIDVDGSYIQIYSVASKKIAVKNDYEVDAVYIDSEIDLSNFITSVV